VVTAMDGAGKRDIDDLASTLFELEIEARTTGAVTRQLTRAIVDWALTRGWRPRVEARVEAMAPSLTAKLGYIDVIVSRSSGEPDLAIEIDSGDKPWSVDKLRHAARAGMEAIWVRWGDEEWAGVYEDIDVIQRWLARRPLHRRTSDPLPLR
jgi:hypothetical protein